MLSGHHTQIAAFAHAAHQRSEIKWACKTLTSCNTSFRVPPPIHATRSFVLHAQSPLSIIGGAAAKVYAANTDTLSTAALSTMFLLALQYCAQPPLTRKFLDSRANKKGITMVEEMVKMSLSAAFFLSCGKFEVEYNPWVNYEHLIHL
jgi:hypothetical protein